MFKRLILGAYADVFVILAFATAATIFLTMVWQALRMSRDQTHRFSELPFNSDRVQARHDSSV